MFPFFNHRFDFCSLQQIYFEIILKTSLASNSPAVEGTNDMLPTTALPLFSSNIFFSLFGSSSEYTTVNFFTPAARSSFLITLASGQTFVSYISAVFKSPGESLLPVPIELRSEERRVGKECRSRWSPYH